MIQIIRAEDRYTAEHGWLTARFSFSFAEYQDPRNMRFGVLRVLNDDIIQPGSGFGMHPHNDMEIVTYVIEGALEHRDSMGNVGQIRAGEVQAMTAGTGVFHSEYNPSDTEATHSLQLWFLPRERGLTPSYGQRKFTKEEQRGRLLPVISGEPTGDELAINQDVTIYMSTLDPEQEVTHVQPEGRRIHLFMIKGTVTLNGEHRLRVGDAARLSDVSEAHVKADVEAEFMLIDMA